MTNYLNNVRKLPKTSIKNEHVTNIKQFKVDQEVILPKLIDLLYGVVWSGDVGTCCDMYQPDQVCSIRLPDITLDNAKTTKNIIMGKVNLLTYMQGNIAGLNEEVMCTHVNGVGTPLTDTGNDDSDEATDEQTANQLYLIANNLIQLGINMLEEVGTYPDSK